MKKSKQELLIKNLKSLKYMGFKFVEQPNFSTPKQNLQQLPSGLDNLKTIVSNCHLCSFSKTRQNILFGIGNDKADIVFLGLAPSMLDDEDDNILSGNSGAMLIKIAQNVLKISIEDIYISNILKCTPNKNDIDMEIDICKSYIKKQLDIIKPKIIVAFGDVYRYLVDEDKPLSKIRGIVQVYNDIKVMPTYHPSFILRNPSLKQELFEDIKKVKTLMESL
jgi:DNA polymerase